MSVQLLNSEYIKKVNPQQVEQWIEQGKVKKQGDQYFVVGDNNITLFNDKTVKDKTYKINAKGIIVERTAPQQPGKVIGEPIKTHSVPINQIIERMGLTDNENLKSEFNTFLSQQQTLKIDQEGNITFNDTKALNNALKAFAEKHQENFINPNTEKYVTFTNDTDNKVIEHLQQGENPAISNQSDGEKRYAVKNMDALNSTLTEQVGDITYESVEAKSAKLSGTSVTKSITEENMVDVPENLRDSRTARKTLQNDAADAYSELVADANKDPKLRDAIDIYIAETRYSKKIAKRMDELKEYTTTLGGTKNKKVERDAGDIIQLYIDNYANKEDKEKLKQSITQIQNSNYKEDQQEIYESLKGAKILGLPDSFDKLDESLKRKGALLAVAKRCGYNSGTLLKLMATYDVMKNRTSTEIINDDKYFIKHQAKDFVKNQQAEQDRANTTVHLTKKGRKNAPDDGKIHNDIGKKGYALVKACPTMLCDEITDPAQFKNDEDNGYFTTTIDGKTRCFKFNQDKWKTFMGICCDPTNATEEQMNILFGNESAAKTKFMEDLNMTLQEGRSVLDMELPSPHGTTGTLKFVNIIGNNNGKIDNKELNTLRDMVESAGYSTDTNTTAGKRALHILKGAGIGFGVGLLTGGLGSLFAGAVQIAGTTPTQAVSLTGNATLDYKTSVTTTDYYHHEFGTTSVTHNTPVSGTTTGKVTLNGQVDGQDYSGEGNTHGNTGLNTGILSAIGGGINNAITSGRIHANGRNTDILFNLKREVPYETTNDEQLSIEIPQYTSVVTKKGTIEIGTEIPKLKAVAYRGPSAYNGLYKYEDGTPVSPRDFAKAYQKKINGIMTDYNFFVYPELEVPGKGKIVPVKNYEAEYKKITPGTSGGRRGVVRNPQGKVTYHAQGTIQ